MRFIPNKLKAQQIIYLLGFMATGKSHTGKLLAQRLNYTFIDLDEYITTETSLNINQIFAQNGEDYFRQLESFYLRQLVNNQPKPIIIALGGGTPCFGDNLTFIKKTGFSIFINTPLSLIFKRLQTQKNSRPLVANLNNSELLSFIQKLYLKRYPFYAQADMEI